MVIERLLLGEHHQLRRQTIATMAERRAASSGVRWSAGLGLIQLALLRKDSRLAVGRRSVPEWKRDRVWRDRSGEHGGKNEDEERDL